MMTFEFLAGCSVIGFPDPAPRNVVQLPESSHTSRDGRKTDSGYPWLYLRQLQGGLTIPLLPGRESSRRLTIDSMAAKHLALVA
jgi:hypothetical protein